MAKAAKENTDDDIPAPRKNPDFLGHEAAERALRDGFESGRLAHAWLLCGPRGIGKATLAYRFARFVLAADKQSGPGAQNDSQAGLFAAAPETAAAPGEGEGLEGEGLYVDPGHPVFRRIAAGGHADLLSVERGVDEKTGRARSEIVVGDIRPLAHFLSLTAAEGGWRVVVIDAADDMNPSAANALLKVLEEPPPRALLLLVSHNPGRLLPTIRSRCRRLVMKPLATATLESLLARYRPDLGTDETAALARLAEGSIGRALSLAEGGGVGLYREFIDLIAPLPDLDYKALHAFGDKLARPGQDDAFRTFAGLAQDWLERLMVRMAAQTSDRAPGGGAASEEERVLVERLARHGDLGAWLAAWDQAAKVLARAETAYLDKKQVALSLFHAFEKAAAPV